MIDTLKHITLTVTKSAAGLNKHILWTPQDYLLLPALNEYTWSSGTRAFLYLSGLLWCFLGVAHVADIFMASIERITSKTRTVRISDPEAENGIREVQLKVSHCQGW